jgi:hypothetical protein
MSASETATAAGTLLDALTDGQRADAALPFDDDAARRWIEYRPRPRPGACLAELSPAARKAAHRLLATALGPHAYAQALAIVSLEEVLDRVEGWRRGRHSGDYWVSVYGDPAGDAPWSWRFEGHHVSVSAAVVDGAVSPSPVFLGANPHRVDWHGHTVSRPLAPEEDLAFALLEAAGPAGRTAAIVADEAPVDIRSAQSASAPPRLEPLGVARGALPAPARDLLDRLVDLYVARVPALAAEIGEPRFAWAGPTTPGTRHYYRVQGEDLLIEYDNTSEDGNHAHTVLRRPRSDFGADLLARHRASAHGAQSG